MIRGIILSSGQSKRMGTQKLLLPLGKHTVVEEAIKNAKESVINDILLVYGEPRERFMDICRKNCIKGIYNEEYYLGQSRSIIKGIEDSEGFKGFLFLLGDQPFIKAEIINNIILKHKKYPQDIIVPVYEGIRGNPVLFPLRFRQELLGLRGDTGGREAIRRNPESIREVNIHSCHAFFDIDIISDYNTAKEIMKHEYI